MFRHVVRAFVRRLACSGAALDADSSFTDLERILRGGKKASQCFRRSLINIFSQTDTRAGFGGWGTDVLLVLKRSVIYWRSSMKNEYNHVGYERFQINIRRFVFSSFLESINRD